MNQAPIIIMTEVTTKPERQPAVWKAMAQIAEIARRQPGCIEYHILQSSKDPAVTINYERWASEAEHEAFMNSKDVAAFVDAIDIPNSFIGNPGPVEYTIMA